jgi:hypothetical protein
MGKMGKFDATGLLELQKELHKLQKPEAFVESCTKKLAGELLGRAIKKTQIGQYPKGSGKVGGTLRRGWTAGQEIKPEEAEKYVDTLPVGHSDKTYSIELINPVEYASYVEYGHRKVNNKGVVEGKKMMTNAEKEMEQIAPRIIEKRVSDYLGGIVK